MVSEPVSCVLLFSEPINAQLVLLLNKFRIYLICMDKNLYYCSVKLQLGQSWEIDENIWLTAPTESQLILGYNILMKQAVTHLHIQIYRFSIEFWLENRCDANTVS